jgi:hypothetical protein
MFQRKQLSLAKLLLGEGICQFARSFDRRRTDTWVLRAVYEEVLAVVPLQVRADASLWQELGLDPEEVDMDICPAIATRACLSLGDRRGDTVSGHVETVRDLVSFFMHQRRVEQS